MKVTRITTHICHAYRTNWVFVKVHTDAGMYGVGEATLEMRELTVAQAIMELERYLVGRDPHDIEAFFHDAYRDSYWRVGPVLMSALAGVDMALWDIKGKDLNVPVYQLLGGKIRDKVPCYANGWFAGAKTPDEFASKAVMAVNNGFTALKWDPFGSEYMNISPAAFTSAIECVEAVRGAVKGKADLLIEGHGRFNIPSAIRIANALASFDVLWFEEPIPPDHREGMAEVRRKSKVPIAAGERLYSRYDFNEFLKYGCADFWQPDVSHAGGISELKKIAAMAECHYIPVCPHNPSGPIANAATRQLAACTPNFYLLETMASDVAYRKDICNEEVRFENGFMKINNKPGLGIDFYEEEVAKYPYEARNLRHYQGTLTDIRPADSKSYFQK